jgi:hypothetical protein
MRTHLSSDEAMPQAFSHIYYNTTNVHGHARSRRDHKDTKYLGDFKTIEVLIRT